MKWKIDTKNLSVDKVFHIEPESGIVEANS